MSILDWLSGSSSGVKPVTVTPQVTPQTAGSVNGGQPVLGGLLRYDPNGGSFGGMGGMTPAQKLGMFGASLSDVAAALRGQPGGNAANYQGGIMQMGMMQRQAMARQTMAQAMQSGDPDAVRKALAGMVAAGNNISGFASRPVAVRNGSTLWSFNPMSGQSAPAGQGQAGQGSVTPANVPQPDGQNTYRYNSNGELLP